MIFTKHAVKSQSGTIWAPGKADIAQDGYFDRADYQIWRLCENYDGKVRGGIRKTWRLSKDNLSLDQAKALLAKKSAQDQTPST